MQPRMLQAPDLEFWMEALMHLHPSILESSLASLVTVYMTKPPIYLNQLSMCSDSDGFRATAFRSMQEEDGVGEY